MILSDSEYEELKPFRDEIVGFESNRNYKGNALNIINTIRQRHGYSALCFNCDGSKAAAMLDMAGWIISYEQNFTKEL